MRISIRPASLFEDPHKRGLISQITDETGIERHTVAALLNNSAKYVSIEKLASLCDYLVRHEICSVEALPGALFGRDAEQFWELLAMQQQQEFFLGSRTSKEWSGVDYVMASDSRLQAVLLSTTARFDLSSKPPREDQSPATAHSQRHYYDFHLVPGPPRNIRATSGDAEWIQPRQEAVDRYLERRAQTGGKALLALGSVKVNPMIEIQIAKAFSAKPFEAQEPARSPKNREVPFFFCYRENDPQPASCLGGRKLASRGDESPPGIYYETANGKWVHCPCDATHDVAYVFYAHYPHEDLVEIACGGFSSRSTDCLATMLVEVASQMGAPQYESDNLRLGLYIISFEIASDSNERRARRTVRRNRAATGGFEPYLAAGNIPFQLIRVDPAVLSGRLEKQKTTRTSSRRRRASRKK